MKKRKEKLLIATNHPTTRDSDIPACDIDFSDEGLLKAKDDYWKWMNETPTYDTEDFSFIFDTQGDLDEWKEHCIQLEKLREMRKAIKVQSKENLQVGDVVEYIGQDSKGVRWVRRLREKNTFENNENNT